MPGLIFIAGPNGAGKTTFANEYLAAEERRFEFVNADEIARGLAEGSEPQSRTDVLAARMMLTVSMNSPRRTRIFALRRRLRA